MRMSVILFNVLFCLGVEVIDVTVVFVKLIPSFFVFALLDIGLIAIMPLA